jgi:hypothetical protein
MVRPLLRHPLTQMVARLWWLPALTATLAWGFGGRADLALAGLIAAASGGALAGVLLAVAAHGPAATLGERLRHRRMGHRFLCPTCLHFGGLWFACEACGHEIEPSIVHTGGRYTDLCPRCDATLGVGEDSSRVRAYCRRCGTHCDRSIYHRRQVRVLATFSFADLLSLHQATAAPVERREGLVCGYDDGERLTYLLSEADLPPGLTYLSPRHAARSVTAIWVDAAAAEPLRLVAEVDRAIQRAGWSAARRRAITVCVREDSLDPAARHLLAARFGAVQFGVTAAAFLAAPRPAAGYPRAERVGGGALLCAVLPPSRPSPSASVVKARPSRRRPSHRLPADARRPGA